MKIQVKFDFLTICNNLLATKLDHLGIKYNLIPPGDIEITQKLNKQEEAALFEALNSSGIEVVNDQQLILVQRIKDILSEIIRLDTYSERTKVSAYLEDKLPHSYNYLSRIFSEIAHMSIEKFMILKKIDYVKELLIQDNLSLTEIAYKLNYSSVSHLSRQFKKTTGFSPSKFIELKKRLKTTN